MHAFLKGGTSSKPAAKDKAGSSGETSKARERLVPWVEKYRPRCVDDVAFQEEVVAMLKKSLEGSDLPNMLFYGPPGTGKTSTILAAGRELFGDMFRTRVLELNASDERGIDVIRNKVKTFAQQTAGGTRPDGRPCPPFKIVILDEADSMTNAAQSALRRTMEKQSKNTRFCLICNYVSRIIEPLTSRCSKFRFKPLSEDVQRKRLLDICQKEGIKCGEEAMNTIISTSEGDLRKAITFLQSAYRLRADEDITVQDIYEIGGVVPNQVMTNLMITCSSGSYEKLEKTVLDLQKEGYAATQVVTQANRTSSGKSQILRLAPRAIKSHHRALWASSYRNCSLLTPTTCMQMDWPGSGSTHMRLRHAALRNQSLPMPSKRSWALAEKCDTWRLRFACHALFSIQRKLK